MKKKLQKYLSGEREGFSLIELIIVIAIMAILIGVVALVVLPYLESSRESTDRAALNEVATAFKSAMTSDTYSKVEISTAVDKDGLAGVVTGKDLETKVNSYLEKSIEATESDLGSAKLDGAKFYFMKTKARGILVFLSKDGNEAITDSDGVPYTSDRKAVK